MYEARPESSINTGTNAGVNAVAMDIPKEHIPST